MDTGILDMVQRVGAVALALTIALPGLDFLLLRGDLFVGGGLLALAALVMIVSEYVRSPSDVPTSTAQRVVAAIAKEPDDEE
ncbi:hypothetical protein BRD19_04700 [Halobacteriales archaeon SW_7_65_23]|jgi:hypothetical protein|nr:MAG: hypothetical protein BRD19_04700 [Halobacteriales archaeon SW_7_65_23]